MNRPTRFTRLIAAAASITVTLALLQSVFTLFASAPAQTLANAAGSAPVLVASAR